MSVGSLAATSVCMLAACTSYDPTPVACSLGERCDVMRDDSRCDPVPWICTVDGVPGVRVVVDSGCSRSAITPDCRDRVAAEAVGAAIGAGPLAGLEFDVVRLGEIGCSDWRLRAGSHAVVDESIESLVGADVLIGYGQFIASGAVWLDLGNGRAWINGSARESGWSDARHAAPLTVRDGVPWVHVDLDGHPVELAIDTGSNAEVVIPISTGRAISARPSGQTMRGIAGGFSLTGWKADGRHFLRLGSELVEVNDLVLVEADGPEHVATQHIGRGVLRKIVAVLDAGSNSAWFRSSDLSGESATTPVTDPGTDSKMELLPSTR